MEKTSATGELTCWVVTDGRAGIEAQALGLAEAVAETRPLQISVKRVIIQSPWRHLPRQFWGDALSRLDQAGASLAPPWPDLWIACGRLSAPLSIAVKRKSPSTFVVQLQDPRAPASLFDLVIAPEHDGVSGRNVVSIVGSTTRVRRRDPSLAERRAAPLVAVLIGGPNRAFRFGRTDARSLSEQLKRLADEGVSLSVTTSRRTPPEAARILEESLSGAACKFWRADCGEKEANPYPEMLEGVDAVIVTEDSVNMAVEAAMTGAPVHIARLRRKPFSSASKFDAFHNSLMARGAAKYFDGEIEHFSYEPLNETKRAAAELSRRLERFASSRFR